MAKKKDNTKLIAVAGVGIAGLAAWALSKKSGGNAPAYAVPQVPVQPYMQPPPRQQQTTTQKAGGVLDLVSKGWNLVKGIWPSKDGTMKGFDGEDKGYYLDHENNRVVVTDPNIEQEVMRKIGLEGVPGSRLKPSA